MKMAKEKESGLGKGCNNEFDDKDKWNLFFYGAGFVIFLSLVLYLWEFNSGLSNNHTKWGEFGSYFGGITGPLISVMAFIGLLKSISLTKSQFEIQSQESTFSTFLTSIQTKLIKYIQSAPIKLMRLNIYARNMEGNIIITALA